MLAVRRLMMRMCRFPTRSVELVRLAEAMCLVVRPHHCYLFVSCEGCRLVPHQGLGLRILIAWAQLQSFHWLHCLWSCSLESATRSSACRPSGRASSRKVASKEPEGSQQGASKEPEGSQQEEQGAREEPEGSQQGARSQKDLWQGVYRRRS